MAQLSYHRVRSLPTTPQADAVYYVLKADATTGKIYVTDAAGTAKLMGDASGDMDAAIYDPESIAADVFDLSHHHSGTIDNPAITIDGGLL